jgi:hypothetical protein
MRSLALILAAVASLPSAVAAQTLEGAVLLGEERRAMQNARLALVTRGMERVDTTTTDAFGYFVLNAPKAGSYSIVLRRPGFLPIVTDRFELGEGEVRVDTVFVDSAMAGRSLSEAIDHNLRSVFGGGARSAIGRLIGPEDLDAYRLRFQTLGDIARNGRILGATAYGTQGQSCIRFSGAQGCAQVFLNGLPIFISVDQINLIDVEAVLGLRGNELGVTVTEGRRFDASRYGAVMVYTTGFNGR